MNAQFARPNCTRFRHPERDRRQTWVKRRRDIQSTNRLKLCLPAEPTRQVVRIGEMPRFTIRTLFIATAGLMAYVTYLSRFPVAILISLSIPALCALLFLPYLSLRLLALLGDPEEATFNSKQLQNCLWTIFVCLVAFAPVISLVATKGFDYLMRFILKSHNIWM